MDIAGATIPDSEIEKLSPSKKRILYRLYDAYPGGVTTWTVLREGGTGFSTRIERLNKDFLCKYDTIIMCKEYIKREGRNVWAYWLARAGDLPIIPKEVYGDV